MKSEGDSIFIHALRSFFVSLFGVAGGLLGVVVIIALFFGIFSSASSDKHLSSKAKVIPNALGIRSPFSPSTPVILHIPIDGTIGLGEITARKINDVLIGSREGALKNDLVKGIILTIDSPGGCANDSYLIYQQLREYKKRYDVPIYAYANGLCASGGYYIACAADQIFASTVSLVGSVGVLGWPPSVNVASALEKLGITTRTFSAGQNKDELNPFRPWHEKEGAQRQYLIDFYYQNFVNVVRENRPKLSEELLVDKYGAGLFPAYQAAEYGYIDHVDADLSMVIAAMAKEAGIEEHYQVVQFETEGWFKQAFGNSVFLSGKIKHELVTPHSGTIDYLYTPSTY